MAPSTRDDVKYGHGHGGGVDVSVTDRVAVLTLRFGENRFNAHSVCKIGEALDQIVGNPDVHALVVRGEGKYFSTGHDLPWIKHLTQTQRRAEVDDYFQAQRRLTARMLTFPMPTVAVVNGHAVAAGAIFALACDVIVMRKDRGFFYLNEVRIGLSVNGMGKVLASTKIPNGEAFTEAVVFGKRLTGYDTQRLGITGAICEQHELLQTGHKMARQALADGPFDRKTMKTHKENLFASVLEADKVMNYVPNPEKFAGALPKAKM